MTPFEFEMRVLLYTMDLEQEAQEAEKLMRQQGGK